MGVCDVLANFYSGNLFVGWIFKSGRSREFWKDWNFWAMGNLYCGAASLAIYMTMLGFLKNKTVGLATDDLDKCIDYLTYGIPKESKEDSSAQIINTIRTYISDIADERISLESVSKHFRNLKTNYCLQNNLQDHRDTDYACYYILSAFFLYVSTSNLEHSKSGINKILNMCDDNVELILRDEVRSITESLREGFELNVDKPKKVAESVHAGFDNEAYPGSIATVEPRVNESVRDGNIVCPKCHWQDLPEDFLKSDAGNQFRKCPACSNNFQVLDGSMGYEKTVFCPQCNRSGGEKAFFPSSAGKNFKKCPDCNMTIQIRL